MGRRPFLGESAALIDEILRQAPALPSKLNHKVSPGLDAIILKCLEKDPSLRYASARDVAVDLRRLAMTSSSTLVVSGPVKKAKKWPWVVAAAVVAALSPVIAVNYHEATLPPPRIVGTRQLTHTQLRKSLGGNTLATDGSRVYFVEQRGVTWVLKQVSIEGGEVFDVPTDFKQRLRVMGISPSASELLVQTCCPPTYWIQPLPAGPPRRAPIPEVVWSATWGRDGRLYYVSSTFNQLYRVNVDGTRNERLIEASNSVDHATVSIDGQHIRYSDVQPKAPNIIETDIRGGDPRLVLPEMKGQTLWGDWTFDGRISFFAQSNNSPYFKPLWGVRERNNPLTIGAPKPSLLYAGPLELTHVIGSRNSKELYAVGAERRGELSVYDPRSSTFVRYLGGISASYVSFSPDGQRIAYVTYPQGDLWRSRVDGSERIAAYIPPNGRDESPVVA
jgi:hypothetical protein